MRTSKNNLSINIQACFDSRNCTFFILILLFVMSSPLFAQYKLDIKVSPQITFRTWESELKSSFQFGPCISAGLANGRWSFYPGYAIHTFAGLESHVAAANRSTISVYACHTISEKTRLGMFAGLMFNRYHYQLRNLEVNNWYFPGASLSWRSKALAMGLSYRINKYFDLGLCYNFEWTSLIQDKMDRWYRANMFRNPYIGAEINWHILNMFKLERSSNTVLAH